MSNATKRWLLPPITIWSLPLAAIALAAAGSASAYDAPFLTSAEVRIYFSDTRGIVEAHGGPVVFHYPGIREVRVAGRRLDGSPVGRDAIEVRLPAGRHEVQIVVSDDPSPTPPQPRSAGGGVIRSADELNQRAGAAQPGDVLVIENGVHTDWRIDLSCIGTKSGPITVRPQTPGGVIFRGITCLNIRGQEIVFRGFLFEHCHNHQGTVIFEDAQNCRLTQCQFFRSGSLRSTFAHLVTLLPGATHNRVDHCYFTGTWCMSVGLRVDNEHVATAPRHNRLDHNIFRDVPRIWFNGQENFQIGSNGWVTPLHTLVEYNLFDNAVGDSEIFSNKSQENVYRYNVAVNCRGCAFHLRGGQGCRVEGNVSINCGGGLIVQDKNHVIVNNLILNSTGPGVTVLSGSAGWDAPTNCLIAHNTLIGNLGGIANVAWSLRPEVLARDNTIQNNLIVSSRGTLLSFPPSAGTAIDGNLLFATGDAGTGDQGTNALLADPLIDGTGVNVRPSRGSPAIDRGSAIAGVKLDRWGRVRDQLCDLGADEAPAGGTPASVLLPEIPKERKWSFGLFKAECLAAYDPTRPIKDWTPLGTFELHEGAVQISDASLVCSLDVPDDFVAEWEYQPESFSSKATLAFADGGESAGYRISWGGADGRDGKPLGRIRLEKGGAGKIVTEAPDTVYFRPNYLPSYVGVRIEADKPNPRLWYHFRLLRKDSYIRLDVNRASVTGRTLGYVPIFAWEDTRGVFGPALHGSGLRIRQEGTGRWRGLHIWRHGYVGDKPPEVPVDFAARAVGSGRIRLTWRDGPQNRSESSYDLHRGAGADFRPGDDNRIASRLTGGRYEDIGVKSGGLQPKTTYHYKLTARNALGRGSGFAAARASTATKGPVFIFTEAEESAALEAPFVVSRGDSWGETFIWAPGSQNLNYDPAVSGEARFEFTVKEPGDYNIWGRVIAPDAGSDSFWVVSPAGEAVGFGMEICRRWTWSVIHRLRPVTLSAGEQVLTFKPREGNAKLDKILITNDLGWRPVQPGP